jgi:tyrosyl-DNA phosphodiesterase-1
MRAATQLASDRELALRLDAEERAAHAGDAASVALAQRLAAADASAAAGPSETHRAKRARTAAAPMPPPLPPSRRDGLGFHLFRAQGAPERHNVDTVSFADMAPPPDGPSGALRYVVWSNVSADVGTICSHCPALLDAQRVFFLCSSAAAADVARCTSGDASRFVAHAPPMRIGSDENHYGSHHAKFVLAAYERCLVVSVHSCNAVDENGATTLTEVLWTQAFLLKNAASPPTSPFEESLIDYLTQAQWPGGAVGGAHVGPHSLRCFDFSPAKAALVATVPGVHRGADAKRRYGHLRVRALLDAERFDGRFVGSAVALQVGAVAKVTLPWLTELLASFGAGHVDDAAATPLGAPTLSDDDDGDACRAFFVWPTAKEVRASAGGWATGGGLPAPRAALEGDAGAAALAACRARWRGGSDAEGRGRYPAHAKTFCRFDAADGAIAYLLLGSHNLSRAAWGERVLQGNALRCKSYELSVLLLPRLAAASSAAPPPRFVSTAFRGGTRAGLSADGATLALRVPYALPPVRYDAHAQGGADAPWSMDTAPRGVADSCGFEILDTPEGTIIREVERSPSRPSGGGSGGGRRSDAAAVDPVVIELD